MNIAVLTSEKTSATTVPQLEDEQDRVLTKVNVEIIFYGVFMSLTPSVDTEQLESVVSDK
jgi:hypothetical protein